MHNCVKKFYKFNSIHSDLLLMGPTVIRAAWKTAARAPHPHRQPQNTAVPHTRKQTKISGGSLNMFFLCAKDWINAGARTGYLPVSHRDGPVF